MVAVAVVGGILIFVFTQGFFADEQVTGFKADSLYVAGYNAKDSTSEDLSDSGGTTLQCPNAKLDGVLSSGDCLLLFVDNRGPDPLAIGEVRVYGTSYTPSTNVTLADDPAGGPTCDDGKSAGGGTINDREFRVYTSASVSNLIVEPNTSSVLCVTYFGNDVKAGKTIPVQIVTENGQILLENVRNGARATAETGTFTTLGGETVPTGTLNFAAVNTGADNRIDVTWSALDNQGSPTIYRLTSSVDGVLVNAANTFSFNIDTTCTQSHSLSMTTSNDNGAGPTGGPIVLADTGIAPSHTGLTLAATGYTGVGATEGRDGAITITWVEGIGNADINCPNTLAVAITGAGAGQLTTSDSATPFGTTDLFDDGDVFGVVYTTTVTDGGAGPAQTSLANLTYDVNCNDSISAASTNPTESGNDGPAAAISWTNPTLIAQGCDYTLLVTATNTSKGGSTELINTSYESGSIPSTSGAFNACTAPNAGGTDGDTITMSVTITAEEGALGTDTDTFTLSGCGAATPDINTFTVNDLAGDLISLSITWDAVAGATSYNILNNGGLLEAGHTGTSGTSVTFTCTGNNGNAITMQANTGATSTNSGTIVCP